MATYQIKHIAIPQNPAQVKQMEAWLAQGLASGAELVGTMPAPNVNSVFCIFKAEKKGAVGNFRLSKTKI